MGLKPPSPPRLVNTKEAHWFAREQYIAGHISVETFETMIALELGFPGFVCPVCKVLGAEGRCKNGHQSVQAVVA